MHRCQHTLRPTCWVIEFCGVVFMRVVEGIVACMVVVESIVVVVSMRVVECAIVIMIAVERIVVLMRGMR